MNEVKLPDFIQKRVAEYYTERVEKTWSGGHIMHGTAPDNNSIILQLNDYLCLGKHKEVITAEAKELKISKNNLMMSAVFFNGTNPQWQLQKDMAEYMESEASVIFQSGYKANVGLLQVIATQDVPVYIDQFAHASLWEGIGAANAKPHAFKHLNTDHLIKQIGRFGPGIVVIDSVYSTYGSVAPIKKTVEIAEQNDCAIVVDESHSLGTYGTQGKGIVVELGLQDRVHFRTASLAKAFCERAGVVACSKEFAEYLTYESFPIIFSSAVLPHELAALSKTLDIIKKDEWRRKKLHYNAKIIKNGLGALGYNVELSDSQIISLEAGKEQDTIILRDALESRGVFGSPFCWPATPKYRSCIRFSINSGLEQQDLDRILQVCDDIREEVNYKQWPSTQKLSDQGISQRRLK